MPELRAIAVVGASLAGLRAVEALRAAGSAGASSGSAPRRASPTTARRCRRRCCAASGSPSARCSRAHGLAGFAAQLHFGRRATRLDVAARRVALDDGSEIAFDGLVIATGASPRLLPNQPRLDGVFTLRTLDDALAIRAMLDEEPRVVVVGGGFIGAEVAGRATRADWTSRWSRRWRPMAQRPGPGPRRALRRDPSASTASTCAPASRCRARRRGSVERVRLADGSVLPADVVVVGIGVRPETAWLEGSGIEVKDGVVCDASCATNAPNVVAAGDVARWTNPRYGESMRVEHWTNAVEQAQAAVARLLDGPEAAKPFDPVPYVWSDEYDTKLAVAGRPRRATRCASSTGRSRRASSSRSTAGRGGSREPSR